jgi:hypothetical protein
VVLSVLVTVQLASDGRSDLLKGTRLLVVYFALALTFFLAALTRTKNGTSKGAGVQPRCAQCGQRADTNHQCLMVVQVDRESLGQSRRIETGKPRDQDANVKHACKLFDHHK